MLRDQDGGADQRVSFSFDFLFEPLWFLLKLLVVVVFIKQGHNDIVIVMDISQ